MSNMIRKFCLFTLILSAVILIFGYRSVNANYFDETSFQKLNNGGFWDKFRDSVNKDGDNPIGSSNPDNYGDDRGGRGDHRGDGEHGGPRGGDHGGDHGGGRAPRMVFIMPS